MVVESRWYGRFASCSCRPDVARSGVAGVLEGGVRQRVPFWTLWGVRRFSMCFPRLLHVMSTQNDAYNGHGVRPLRKGSKYDRN